MKVSRLILGLILALTLGLIPRAEAQETIKLMQPDLSQPGKNVLQAMKDRHSERTYGVGDLSLKQLSEVLWAAGGVNRTLEDGKIGRTAPSSHNDQAIDIYAFTKTAVYKYDPVAHELVLFLTGDHRETSGVQSYVSNAPLNLVYVADISKVSGDTNDYKIRLVSMDVGHMSENVYLYAAAYGLNAICRSNIDPSELRTLLKLGDHFEPLLGQTVGLPQ